MMHSTKDAPGSDAVLEAPAPAFSADEAEQLAREVFGVVGRVAPLESERDQNFRIQPGAAGASSDAGHVLKISNQAEDPAVLDLQQCALIHIAAVDPELSVPRLCLTQGGARSHTVRGANGASHSVWLLSYLPGRRLSDVLPTPRLRHELGSAIARLARALRGFFHPAAGRELLWDLKRASLLRVHLAEIDDPARRRLAEDALDRFDANTSSVLPSLRAQVIHSDANGGNVIVDAADEEHIAGFIDFGDMVHSALINDLGIALASTIDDRNAPIESACEIVAGYHAVTPLLPEELSVLFDLWCARLCAEVSISAWRSKSHPENVDYISGGEAESAAMLERLAQLERVDPDGAQRRFRAACHLEGPGRPVRSG